MARLPSIEVPIDAPAGRPETGSITTYAPGLEVAAVSVNVSGLPAVAVKRYLSGCVAGAQTIRVLAARALGSSRSIASAASATTGSVRAGAGRALTREGFGRESSVFTGLIRFSIEAESRDGCYQPPRSLSGFASTGRLGLLVRDHGRLRLGLRLHGRLQRSHLHDCRVAVGDLLAVGRGAHDGGDVRVVLLRVRRLQV